MFGRWRAETGAVVVEFALALMLLIPLVGGGIDAATVFQTKRDLSDAARAASRSSAQPCFGSTNCSAGNATDADTRIATSLLRSVGEDARSVKKLIIYKASANSDQVPASCLTATIGVAGVCNVTPNPVKADGTLATLNTSMWPSSSRVRAGDTADYLGVYAELAKRNLFGFFQGKSTTVKARATFRLEPIIITQSPLPNLPTWPQQPFPWVWTEPVVGGGGGGGATPTPGNGAG